MDPDLAGVAFKAELSFLRLLHLSDSALPIGALAHSLGIETLVSEGLLKVSDLQNFLRGYLEEAGRVEATFCRAASHLARSWEKTPSGRYWVEINPRPEAQLCRSPCYPFRRNHGSGA